MDITKMSEAQFLCDGNRFDSSPVYPPIDQMRAAYIPFLGPLIRDLGQGYAIHRINAEPGDVVLMHGGEMVG